MKRAFTLVELIVVIGIIGILMAVLLGTFGGSTESARSAKCLSNMHNLAMAAHAYGQQIISSTYPNIHELPYAGSFDEDLGDGKKGQCPGWISWGSKGASGSYISPYDKNITAREYSLTNGTLWSCIGNTRESYVCPGHVRYAKDKRLGEPLWSYAMSAYFIWNSAELPRARFPHFTGIDPRKLTRSDRTLMFAELPYAEAETSSHSVFQKGHTSTSAGKENDPVLQYPECAGEGDETIGFNHKDGKVTVAHVCFADGHTEKLRAPSKFSESDAKDLTRWLCCPRDENGDFDVVFDGSKYKKVQ